LVPLGQCSAKVAGEDDGNITRKMFFSFQEEVEKLGVSAMEYKQRRTIENEKLVKLGMKPEKVGALSREPAPACARELGHSLHAKVSCCRCATAAQRKLGARPPVHDPSSIDALEC
jgi:hypothetical protein